MARSTKAFSSFWLSSFGIIIGDLTAPSSALSACGTALMIADDGAKRADTISSIPPCAWGIQVKARCTFSFFPAFMPSSGMSLSCPSSTSLPRDITRATNSTRSLVGRSWSSLNLDTVAFSSASIIGISPTISTLPSAYRPSTNTMPSGAFMTSMSKEALALAVLTTDFTCPAIASAIASRSLSLVLSCSTTFPRSSCSAASKPPAALIASVISVMSLMSTSPNLASIQSSTCA